jgi:hypothetical protein
MRIVFNSTLTYLSSTFNMMHRVHIDGDGNAFQVWET